MIKRGFAILRTEGIATFIQAILRTARLNYRGYGYFVSHELRSRTPLGHSTSDPFTVIQVDPKEIQLWPRISIDQWADIGEVWAGDWDRTNRTVDASIKYRSLIDHFEHDVPWEETEIHRRAYERIENNESYWNGCRSHSDLERRTNEVDSLFAKIRENGYQSQSDILGKDVRSTLLSGGFDRSQTDVTVAIGRGGELLFIDGHHRLAISHVLGLDNIWVRVVVRHATWESMRQTVRNANDIDSLTEGVRKHLSHPDIEYLS